MKVGIIGGETHIAEITALRGKELEIAGAAVRPDQVEWARKQFECPVFTSTRDLLAGGLDLVAVANENDRKAEAICAGLAAGCDAVVDKPLANTLEQQEQVEDHLRRYSDRRLLMLLTLRGSPLWAGLRRVVHDGAVGTPAFTHIRMAVKLKRAERPPWFLDVRRSGGLFVDLLIHALDQVEWLTGRRIVAITANTGNLGDTSDLYLRDHAAAYCELDDGSSAVVEGQRMLPDTKTSDYRVTIAGTQGYTDLGMAAGTLTVTTPAGADTPVDDLPAKVSVVEDWLHGGSLVDQEASLRANRLAVLATISADEHRRIEIPGE